MKNKKVNFDEVGLRINLLLEDIANEFRTSITRRNENLALNINESDPSLTLEYVFALRQIMKMQERLRAIAYFATQSEAVASVGSIWSASEYCGYVSSASRGNRPNPERLYVAEIVSYISDCVMPRCLEAINK